MYYQNIEGFEENKERYEDKIMNIGKVIGTAFAAIFLASDGAADPLAEERRRVASIAETRFALPMNNTNSNWVSLSLGSTLPPTFFENLPSEDNEPIDWENDPLLLEIDEGKESDAFSDIRKKNKQFLKLAKQELYRKNDWKSTLNMSLTEESTHLQKILNQRYGQFLDDNREYIVYTSAVEALRTEISSYTTAYIQFMKHCIARGFSQTQFDDLLQRYARIKNKEKEVPGLVSNATPPYEKEDAAKVATIYLKLQLTVFKRAATLLKEGSPGLDRELEIYRKALHEFLRTYPIMTPLIVDPPQTEDALTREIGSTDEGLRKMTRWTSEAQLKSCNDEFDTFIKTAEQIADFEKAMIRRYDAQQELYIAISDNEGWDKQRELYEKLSRITAEAEKARLAINRPYASEVDNPKSLESIRLDVEKVNNLFNRLTVTSDLRDAHNLNSFLVQNADYYKLLDHLKMVNTNFSF